MSPPLSRRSVIKHGAALTGVALASVVGTTSLAAAAQAAARPTPNPAADMEQVLTGRPSLNGWEMEKIADAGGSIWTRPVPGTPLDGVRVRIGDVETVLVHVVRRFHYEIDELRRDDVIGWRHPGSVRKGLTESNQASGTALQIRPGFYPSGARGGFFPNQVIVIRDVLAELDGVVRWGGDDNKPDEALFYIDVKPGDPSLAKVAVKLRGWADTPGGGAGVLIDPLLPRRQQAARQLARQQS